MEEYIEKTFLKYSHTKPTHPQLTPHKHWEIKYGSKQQLIPTEDTSTDLDATDVKKIKQSLEHSYDMHGMSTTNYY